ncbi:MAG: leucine-rich repeat domain-containing protein [Lachnospiraceae bacterium]|jgi:hypothetical protein|nr:leucine-rich repeat domain-containing protein [Lachnospiraceae bacterium]
MKKLLPLLLTITLTLTLAACSRGGDSDDAAGQGSAAGAQQAAPSLKDWPETPVEDFDYKYDGELGGVVITKYKGKNSLRVRIPAEIDGQPVVGTGTYISGRWIYGPFGKTGVMEVYLPDTMLSIGDYAFRESGIVSITIPNSVTRIGAGAFYGCQGLTSVVVPDSVTIMGARYRSSSEWGVFEDCRSLTSVTIGNGVTYIGEGTFAGADALTSVTIGNSVANIGKRAFSGCTALTSIAIPDSVTVIGEEAFRGCTALTSITIPDSVGEIRSRTFADCTALTSIAIPDSVFKIADNAFEGCTALTTDVFEGLTRTGDLIQLDGYSWLVLDVQDGKALVISEYVLEERAYHEDDGDITWAECDLRAYLNGEFYDSLGADIKARIVETQVVNDRNTKYGTPGGEDTTDKIFLLSIREAETYFSNDSARAAYDLNGEGALWWLRSPGGRSGSAAFVYGDGVLDVIGNGVYGYFVGGGVRYYGGVRPAFWINL